MHGAVILCAQRVDLIDARLHQQGIGDVVKLVVGLFELAAHAEHLGAHALYLRTVRPLLLSLTGHGKASVRFSVYSMSAAAVLVRAQRNFPGIAARAAHILCSDNISDARCSEADPRRPPGTQAAAQHPIPARALQAAASSAGTTRSGPPERRSARIASSAGAAGESPKGSGAAGSALFAFPVYFLEFLAFPALIRYTRLVKV